MDWRQKHADKLRPAEDAVRLIKSGDSVYLGMFGSNPEGLAKALFARHAELTNVSIYHYVAPFVWATPVTAGHFRLGPISSRRHFSSLGNSPNFGKLVVARL